MLNIAAVSDLHGCWGELDPPPFADVLVFAGDITADGSYQNWIQFVRWASQFKSAYQRLIAIPGNHDSILENPSMRLVAEDDARQNGLVLLNDSGVWVGSNYIWGSPWSIKYGRWSFMDSDEGLKRRYANIPKDTSVLISHGPPLGAVDRVPVRGNPKCVQNTGSASLVDACYDLPKLKAVICGHIHECGGKHDYLVSATGVDVPVYNVAMMSRFDQNEHWVQISV